MDSDLRKQMKLRDKLHKRFRRTSSQSDREMFKRQRNKVNNMKKYARNNFYENVHGLIDQLQYKDSKSYWKLIKKLMKSSGSSTAIPPLLYNDELYYDDKSKAEILNNYFASISYINDSNTNPPNFPKRTDSELNSLIITQDEIRDILKILKLGKASGADCISHHLLKNTIQSICSPLEILLICHCRIVSFLNNESMQILFL